MKLKKATKKIPIWLIVCLILTIAICVPIALVLGSTSNYINQLTEQGTAIAAQYDLSDAEISVSPGEVSDGYTFYKLEINNAY